MAADEDLSFRDRGTITYHALRGLFRTSNNARLLFSSDIPFIIILNVAFCFPPVLLLQRTVPLGKEDFVNLVNSVIKEILKP